MAKFRPVDPSAHPARDRPRMRKDDGAAMAINQFGEDSLAMVYGGDVMVESSAMSSHAVEATIKQDEAEEEAVAVPTPIGCWKVIAPDGREERVFKPIPGFEHLFNGSAQSQGVSSLTDSPKVVATPTYRNAVAQVPATATSKQGQVKKRKRTRSRTRGPPRQTIAQQLSDEEYDDQHDDGDASVPTVKSYTFHIGDVEELKRFFRRRLDELTMKPVRPIVTAWVKLLEPKRLTRFGPYHKKLPKEQPQGCTPPWWPQDVPYEEPSHLDKAGLLTLAVDLMLQHRNIDRVKRTMDWVDKLQEVATYAVKTTPPDQFSSSKGSAFSEKMQKRALDEILPNLFDIALSHQEHLAGYNLYQGTNSHTGSPGTAVGTRVTWQPLTRPPRQPCAPRKRFRRTKTTPPPRVEYGADGSGHETEVGNTVIESHLRRKKKAQEPRQQVQASGLGPVASQPQHMRPHNSTTMPNTSFGQSMHAVRLGGHVDPDAKVADHASYNDQTPGHNEFHGNQPMQCSASHSGYHHVPQPQQGIGPCGIAPVSASGYDQPFSLLPTLYHPHAEDTAFNSNAAFPYEYDMFVPSFFDGLPSLNGIGCQLEASYDYELVT